jgi:twitching motility protein PilT
MENNYLQQFEKILLAIIEHGASDLHLSVGSIPHMRVSGTLTGMITFSELDQASLVAFLKIMTLETEVQKLLEKKEIDFAYQYGDRLRLRGNAFITNGKLGVVLRTIGTIKTFAELALPENLKDFCNQKQGFFLVVGPVGQGKSTTLAAMIDIINKERSEHIVTIESPVEYVHTPQRSLIDQREVGLDTETFETGLNAAFRQDVNVLLIGEMRDKETIAAAVTASETGHLVFATLHTNSAAQTIDRIIDTFPAAQQDQVRMQLSGSLLGIFSQRLLPSSAGGRVPAYELLINTKGVANTIREGRTHEIDMLIETGTEHGMISMNTSLINLVRDGHISVEDARKYTMNKDSLDRMLGIV